MSVSMCHLQVHLSYLIVRVDRERMHALSLVHHEFRPLHPRVTAVAPPRKRGRPLPGASRSPSMRSRAKRERHLTTTGLLTPTMSIISCVEHLSSPSKTIRARNTALCSEVSA